MQNAKSQIRKTQLGPRLFRGTNVKPKLLFLSLSAQESEIWTNCTILMKRWGMIRAMRELLAQEKALLHLPMLSTMFDDGLSDGRG